MAEFEVAEMPPRRLQGSAASAPKATPELTAELSARIGKLNDSSESPVNPCRAPHGFLGNGRRR